jgi:MFS family permease
MLIACRVIQGVGASAYMANNQGVITQIFPTNERGKPLGILAAAVAVGTMIGPPLGGLIISVLPWNYIFLINVPIGIFILFAAILFLFGALIIGQKTGYGNGRSYSFNNTFVWLYEPKIAISCI